MIAAVVRMTTCRNSGWIPTTSGKILSEGRTVWNMII